MKIHVSKSKLKDAGRGVFASKNIRKGEIIEIVPFLVVDNREAINKTSLQHYVYEHRKDTYLLALGYGSLYNHSKNPSAVYELCNDMLHFVAVRSIKKGEEIYISYGSHFDGVY